MAILNITPDSFYKGSRVESGDVLSIAEKMLAEGADILDIGAMSSRPGAEEIPTTEELERLIPAVKSIRKEYPNALLSIDTYRSDVVRAVATEGADIINDISAGTIDDQLYSAVAECNLPYIMMHMQGRPETMQNAPSYDDVVLEVMCFLSQRIFTAREHGVRDLVIDPGIGFGKTIAHNFKLIKHLKSFEIYDLPILMGISRKSFLYKILDTSPEQALNATSAMHMLCLQNGANILRVHDVREAVECVQLYEEYKKS